MLSQPLWSAIDVYIKNKHPCLTVLAHPLNFDRWLLHDEDCEESLYFNVPWYTKAFSPKSSLTDLLYSGLNNPNTDEPDPVIAAYMAPS